MGSFQFYCIPKKKRTYLTASFRGFLLFGKAMQGQTIVHDKCICHDFDLAVAFHRRQLGVCWGPTACWALCAFRRCDDSESPETQIPSMLQEVFLFLIDDNQQPHSKDTENNNE